MTGVRSLRVLPGPLLLLPAEPSLTAHRALYGELPRPDLDQLIATLTAAGVRGRGGAGFPLASKLATVAEHGRRAPVVVNFSEGEPASMKDYALATTHPHLVLDGAEIVAGALRSKVVHVVVPQELPEVERALTRALDERPGSRLRWRVHHAVPRFTSGEGSAVVELIEGRENLPVTSWRPTAIEGIRGRATVLSNAETFAHAAALATDPAYYRSLGTPDEPGTRLLTIDGDGAEPRVVEVEHGVSWSSVLPVDLLLQPILLGGYHGTWAAAGALVDRTVSEPDLRESGLTIGAGVVLPLGAGHCPLVRTASIAHYLAGQSAGRCGPCFNGLPALARSFTELVHGSPTEERVRQLVGLVERRGACAHPDGTIRLIRSALRAFPEEVAEHTDGRCRHGLVPAESVAAS